MFRWMMDWFRDRKIAADFKESEQRARRTRAREADDKFSTSEFENDVEKRMAVPHRNADARYNETITRLKRAIGWQIEEKSRNEERLAILQRDYKDELNALFQQIQRVKRDRAVMFELRNKQGYSFGRINRELSQLCAGLADNRDRLHQNEVARTAFLDREKSKNGVDDLERRIGSLRQQHQAFLQAFVEPAAVEERRRIHREQWLTRHR